MRHIKYEEIDSTNLEAKRLIDSQAIHQITIISAKIQTHGRGRMDRSWVSIQGNMMFSIIIPQKWVKNNLLPICVCIAIYEVISPNNNVYFKWPNDILIVNDVPKKCCGVLIENYNDYFIVGIGVNIVSHPLHDMRFPVTHLQLNNLQIQSEESIARQLLLCLNIPAKAVLDTWSKRNFFQGKAVEINGFGGIFQNINDDMSIEIQNQDTVKTFHYGDLSSFN
ncbi:MAG: BirA family biotin operon repressor/biotin-[acetyl-CoA-carboxylase] ligase [Candidatus Deianiraeaceae bacterium]